MAEHSGAGASAVEPQAETHTQAEALLERARARRAAAGAASHHPQTTTVTAGAHTPGAAVTRTSRVRVVKAKFPWNKETGAASTDLHIEVGSLVEVIADEGDWLTGKLAGREGIFPANYVEETDEELPDQFSEPRDATDRTADSFLDSSSDDSSSDDSSSSDDEQSEDDEPSDTRARLASALLADASDEAEAARRDADRYLRELEEARSQVQALEEERVQTVQATAAEVQALPCNDDLILEAASTIAEQQVIIHSRISSVNGHPVTSKRELARALQQADDATAPRKGAQELRLRLPSSHALAAQIRAAASDAEATLAEAHGELDTATWRANVAEARLARLEQAAQALLPDPDDGGLQRTTTEKLSGVGSALETLEMRNDELVAELETAKQQHERALQQLAEQLEARYAAQLHEQRAQLERDVATAERKAEAAEDALDALTALGEASAATWASRVDSLQKELEEMKRPPQSHGPRAPPPRPPGWVPTEQAMPEAVPRAPVAPPRATGHATTVQELTEAEIPEAVPDLVRTASATFKKQAQALREQQHADSDSDPDDHESDASPTAPSRRKKRREEKAVQALSDTKDDWQRVKIRQLASRLKDHADYPPLVAECCRALQQRIGGTVESDDGARLPDSVVQVVVGALGQHATHKDVQEHALHLLQTMTKRKPKAFIHAVEKRGVAAAQELLIAIEASSDAQLVAVCCGSLHVLARPKEGCDVRDAIVSTRGVDVVGAAMSSHAEDRLIQLNACKLLATVCSSKHCGKGAHAVRQVGAVDLAMEAVRQFPERPEIVQAVQDLIQCVPDDGYEGGTRALALGQHEDSLAQDVRDLNAYFPATQSHLRSVSRVILLRVNFDGVSVVGPSRLESSSDQHRSARDSPICETYTFVKVKSWAAMKGQVTFKVSRDDVNHNLQSDSVTFSTHLSTELCELLRGVVLHLAAARKRSKMVERTLQAGDAQQEQEISADAAIRDRFSEARDAIARTPSAFGKIKKSDRKGRTAVALTVQSASLYRVRSEITGGKSGDGYIYIGERSVLLYKGDPRIRGASVKVKEVLFTIPKVRGLLEEEMLRPDGKLKEGKQWFHLYRPGHEKPKQRLRTYAYQGQRIVDLIQSRRHALAQLVPDAAKEAEKLNKRKLFQLLLDHEQLVSGAQQRRIVDEMQRRLQQQQRMAEDAKAALEEDRARCLRELDIQRQQRDAELQRKVDIETAAVEDARRRAEAKGAAGEAELRRIQETVQVALARQAQEAEREKAALEEQMRRTLSDLDRAQQEEVDRAQAALEDVRRRAREEERAILDHKREQRDRIRALSAEEAMQREEEAASRQRSVDLTRPDIDALAIHWPSGGATKTEISGIVVDSRVISVNGHLVRSQDDVTRALEGAGRAQHTLVVESPASAVVAEQTRTCCICFDEVQRLDGYECDGDDRHFVCDECLTGHVQAKMDEDMAHLEAVVSAAARLVSLSFLPVNCSRLYSVDYVNTICVLWAGWQGFLPVQNPW